MNNYANIDIKEIVARIAYSDSVEYDENLVVKLLGRFRDGSDNARPLLVSDEILSVEGKADRRLVAERLYSVFAPAKVLVVIRSQPKLCESMYLHFIRSSGERRISFGSWLDKTYGQIDPGYYRVGLDYLSLIELYRETFGGENVLVLPIELLDSMTGQNGGGFVDMLSRLLGVSVDWLQSRIYAPAENRRQSARFQKVVDFQNILPGHVNLAVFGREFLFEQMYKYVHKIITSGRRIDAPEMPYVWQEKLTQLCGPSNSKIAYQTGLPLADLGYPVV
jgi:hypothetical protein